MNEIGWIKRLEEHLARPLDITVTRGLALKLLLAAVLSGYALGASASWQPPQQPCPPAATAKVGGE